MNICKRCKKEFYSDKYKSCLSCREYSKKYRDQIPREYKQGTCTTKNGINKLCSDCNEVKELCKFYKHKKYKDGYRNQCIDCHSERWKQYYRNGYNNVLKHRLQIDEIYKLKQNQRSYIHQQLQKKGCVKENKTMELIGCSTSILKCWLSFQFSKTINWDSKLWQVDHVVPVSLFNLSNEKERVLAFHWTNIQPLSKHENISKSNKFYPIHYCNSLIIACRFIRLKQLPKSEYTIIKERLEYVKNKFSLRHFQIAGNPC